MCEQWYSECRLDMFTPGVADRSLEICDGNSLLCYRLRDLNLTEEEFCNSMGFRVRDNECFDGNSAVSKKGRVKEKEKQKKDKSIVIYMLCTAGGCLSIIILAMVYSNRKNRVKDIRQLRLKALELQQMMHLRQAGQEHSIGSKEKD